ncbi:hypothetical protein SteCoe_21179 [Stentor coeruleus]|uniref:Solute carrier family 25 member 38 homolog n=1 Tax=Stentor coeruleus TaxID=5963 RepID=A0A1R2BPZ8_9CILI|nr:hypothetical protein SteCoe_21179 [Stentor coeruleus]
MDNTFIRGSISGIITASLIQPLDVIKTTILTVNHNFSIPQSRTFIKQQYGLQGYWRGLRPACYKAFIGSGITFYYLEVFKSLISPSNTGFISNSIIAMISRGLTIITLSPLSIIKVRMEAPQGIGYKSVSDGIVRIYTEEGIKGYYRGLTSCLLRDLPFAGLAYGFYELFSGFFSSLSGIEKPTLVHRAIAGATAGFSATLLTQPFDIIKTRQQFSHMANHSDYKYKSIFDAFVKIYQNEGFAGYTIGLKIRIIERSSAYTIVWVIYEKLKIVGMKKD